MGGVTLLSKWSTFSQELDREPNPCLPLKSGEEMRKSLQKQTFVVLGGFFVFWVFLSRLRGEKVLLKRKGACITLCSLTSQIELSKKRFILMPPFLAF